MRPIIAIRTHKWAEEEERLLSKLREVEGHDLAVVFHNRPKGLKLPLDVIDIDDGWLADNQLATPRDWGWRCGDYFYYALRQARPNHHYYWLVEPDVYVSGHASAFFSQFEGVVTDALGYDLAPVAGHSPYTRAMPGMAHQKAIFALTRLSGRALDRLLPLRQAFSVNAPAPRFFANDEVFVFTHSTTDKELTTGRLEDIAPEWFDGVRFTPSPDMLAEVLDDAELPDGRVFHPVRERAAFKQAMASRLAGNHSYFLNNILGALERFDEHELEAIAEDAGRQIRDQVMGGRQRALRSARRRAR